jgi:hypothetical protein
VRVVAEQLASAGYNALHPRTRRDGGFGAWFKFLKTEARRVRRSNHVSAKH